MAEPSPKRRKTSPTPGTFQPRNQLRRTPPRRASFMSPTKASMSRFNPELLNRPTSAGPDAQPRPGSRGDDTAENEERPDEQAREQPQASRAQEQRASRELPSRDILQQAAAEQDTVRTPVARRPSAVRTGAADEEAELPGYPLGSPAMQPDLPPKEGLFSSPSKRPRRNKSLGQRLSSPFKPRPVSRGEEQRPREATAGAEKSDVQVQQEPRQTQPGPAASQTRDAPAPTQESEVVKDERRLPSTAGPKHTGPDPRHKEKEDLQSRLKELRDEVSQYEREVERSRTAPEENEDFSDLINLINKSAPSPPSMQAAPPPLSTLLASFLPLSKPVKPPTPPDEKEESKSLPTHEPMDLDDPLPYLRLFTPFTYESSIQVPSSSSSSSAPQQIHTISMRSPSSLLRLDFDMTIDTAAQRISATTVHHLSPWAAPELSPFLSSRAHDNDVSALTWATTSYWTLATKRAKCWARLHRAYPHLLGGAPGSESTTTKTKAKSAPKAAKAPSEQAPSQRRVPATQDSTQPQDEEEEVSGIDIHATTTGTQQQPAQSRSSTPPLTRADLHRHLGRSALEFRTPEARLRITWDIRFDWTGEAESVVGAQLAVPRVWREMDGRGCLGGVEEVFRRLVGERGVGGAVGVVVGVVFG